MKKITIIAAVALLATLIFSCKKDTGLSASNSSNPIPTLPANEYKTVSDWLALSFAPDATGITTTLQANQAIIVGYPGMSDLKHFAFVRLQGRESYVYQSLPTTISSQTGNFWLSYNISNSAFKLAVTNADIPGPIADAAVFSSYKYRYVIVSHAVYNRYQIDWTNYAQVASVLGFQQ